METSDDAEREVFLADDEEEEEDVEVNRMHFASVMGNPGAQLSRLNVNEDIDDDDNDEVDTNNRGGGLSSKAGIILVRRVI
jgi:hypothetical protein